MTKNQSTLSEFAYNIAEFFGATAEKNKTGTFVEEALQTHRRQGGKHVVLLVSNGLSEEKESVTNEKSGFRVLKNGELSDKTVLALGKDRSVQIYRDTVDCINHSTRLNLNSLVSHARFFNAGKYGSDQQLISQICSHIHESSQPTFSVACLSSAFLTQNGQTTANAKMISQLIEATNSTGTLFLLTSRHQSTRTGKNGTDATLHPIVPLVIASELLRHVKQLEKPHQEEAQLTKKELSKEELAKKRALARLNQSHSR